MNKNIVIIVLAVLAGANLAAVVLPVPLASGSKITEFKEGIGSVEASFGAGGGTNESIELLIPKNTYVLSATMSVSGAPLTPGGTDYPQKVQLDIGADDVIEWEWIGQGYGALGKQTIFWNGTDHIDVDLPGAGFDVSAKIRMPTGAVVTDASLDVKGGDLVNYQKTVLHGKSKGFMGWYLANKDGDVNGDGINDILAAAPTSTSYWGVPGEAFLFLGNETITDLPFKVLTSPDSYDDFAYKLDFAGDVNKDGYDDIIVAARQAENQTGASTGVVYLYHGGPNMDTTPDVMFYGTEAGEYFGRSVAGIDDVNNDGYDDILIGAIYNDTPADINDAGAAYVFYGGDPMDNVADLSIYGTDTYDYLGSSVGSAGDFNADGNPDFMVASYGDDSVGDGSVHIYFGGPSIDNVTDVFLNPSTGYYFGWFVNSIGDINGDTHDDIGINNNEDVWIYYGGPDPDANRDIRLIGGGGEWFGTQFDGAGDVNGDGYGDLVVGAPAYSTAVSYIGRGYLFFGGDPMDQNPDYTYTGVNEGDEAGYGVCGPGDVNNDGYLDFIIGHDGDDGAGENAGKVAVVHYYEGIKTPSIAINDTDNVLWAGPAFFQDNLTGIDISTPFNDSVSELYSTFTDKFGNEFIDMIMNVSANSRTDLDIGGLDIYYEHNAKIADFSEIIVDFMDENAAEADGYFHVPVSIVSKTAGRVVLSDLEVTVDNAPTVSGTPPGLSLAEGGKDMALLNLRDLFQDDFNEDQDLMFTVLDYTNKSYIRISIKDDYLLTANAESSTLDINWTGETKVSVVAVDLRGLTSEAVDVIIHVIDVPDAPVITTVPPRTAMEDRAYIYQVMADDGDGDSLSYKLVTGPFGMSINTSSGLIGWVPRLEDIKDHTVNVVVSDGTFNDTQEFVLTVSERVAPGNRLPEVRSTPPKTGKVGQVFTYRVDAMDPDKDPLEFSLFGGPGGMTIDKNTGRLTWLPGAGDQGLVFISINVSDGKDRVFHEFIIEVLEGVANDPPKMEGTPPDIAYVGIQYNFKFGSSDDNPGDVLSFALVMAPSGMSLTKDGSLSWMPSEFQVGEHDFTVSLSDGKESDASTFNVTVAVNHAPVITSQPVLDGIVDRQYRYAVTVTDADMDDLTITLNSGPPGAYIEAGVNELVWTPAKVNVGSNIISIAVSDGKVSVYQNFTISVIAATEGGLDDDQGMFGGSAMPFVLLALVLVAVIIGGAIYMSWMKRGEVAGMAKEEPSLIIEDVFLIYKDGRLMSHHTRRLKPEADSEIITSMLTAVQDFVKESLPTEGEERQGISEITLGNDRIALQHGELVYIAAVVKGDDLGHFPQRMQATVREIETIYGGILSEWTGELDTLKGAKLLMKELLKEGPAPIPLKTDLTGSDKDEGEEEDEEEKEKNEEPVRPKKKRVQGKKKTQGRKNKGKRRH